MTFNYYSSAREPCLALTAERETCVDLSSQKIHELLRIEELLSQAQQRIAVALSMYAHTDTHTESLMKKQEFLVWILGEKNTQLFQESEKRVLSFRQEQEEKVKAKLALSALQY